MNAERLRAATRRNQAQARLSVAVAALLTFLGLSVPLLSARMYFGTDLARSDVAYLCALRDQIAHHQGLLLSPRIGDGYFLWGHPIAQLSYPLRWVELLFPADLGASIGVVLHLSLAAATCTLLALTFRLRPWLACTAGISFAFSGPCLDLINWTFCIVAAAWLPLAWASARLSMRRRSSRWSPALLGLSLVMLLLGGETQEYCVGVALVLLEGGALLIRRRRAAGAHLVRLTLICLAAGAMGLVVWLPASAEVQLTRRHGFMRESEALGSSLPPAALLGLVLPNVVNEPVQPNGSLWNAAQGGIGSGVRWDPNPFMGGLLLGAALLGMRRRRARTAAVVFVIGLVFALGSNTPVLPLLMKVLPPLRLFRYPAKYALVGCLGLLLCGFQTLQQCARSVQERRRMALISAGLVALLFVGVHWTERHRDFLHELAVQTSVGLPEPGLPELSELLQRAALVQSAFLLAALFMLWRSRYAKWLPLLVVLQLCRAAQGTIRMEAPLAQEHSPLAETASRLCVAPRSQGLVLSHPGGHEKERFHRFLDLPDLQACDGLVSPIPYAPFRMRTTEQLASALNGGSVAAARALGCTEAIFVQPALAGSRPLTWNAPTEIQEALSAVPLVSVLDPLPEVFALQNPQVLDERAAVTALLATDSSTQALAVVDDPLARLSQESLPSGAGVRSVTARWRSRDDVLVTAEGSGSAVVGVRTSFLAGWTAVQNEQELPVVRVAGQQTGALVNEVGVGPIRFRYKVPRLKEGVAAALLGLCVMIAGVGFRPGKLTR